MRILNPPKSEKIGKNASAYAAERLVLGVVHKLRLQDEVGRWLSKCQQMSTRGR